MDTPNNAKSDASLLHPNEARSLQPRSEELEMERQHAQLAAVGGTEPIQEEYARRIEKLNAEVTRHGALQEREKAQTQSEQTLHAEIDRLVREAQEKNLILQYRNDELARVKADRDALQESCKELASAMSRTETAVTGNAENMPAEFQAQLALPHAELSQKESASEEQRVAASGMNLAHSEQIEARRPPLAQTETSTWENNDRFVLGDETVTVEQQQHRRKQREVIGAATSGDDRAFPASGNRRWHSRYGWKRRWKMTARATPPRLVPTTKTTAQCERNADPIKPANTTSTEGWS